MTSQLYETHIVKRSKRRLSSKRSRSRPVLSCSSDTKEDASRVAHAVASAIDLNVAAVEDEDEDEEVTPPSENTQDTISNGSYISDSEEDTLRVAHAVASAIDLNVAAVEDEQ